MSKQRIISTKFWSDPFIQDLKPDEKLLYIYLMTNERTSICGIYEITDKTISFDTGLTVPRVQQVVDSLVQSGKLRKYENWVLLTNFTKHQKSNPSVEAGIERAKKELPQGLLDRLYTDCPQSGLLELELKPELKLELELNREGASSPTPAQTMRDFIAIVKSQGETYETFSLTISSRFGLDIEIVRRELDKFVEYWTEKNKTGLKERWELQKVFEVQRRISKWFQNVGKFQGVQVKKQGVFIS
jgi:hypothetical protein